MVSLRNKVFVSTKHGESAFLTFNGIEDSHEHFALVFKNADDQICPIVRIHSECITGDLFGSNLCDCGDQLNEAIETFSRIGGIIIYLRQEGRGIGLYNKLDAYTLQQKGFDTFEANCLLNLPEDMRTYNIAAKMLKVMKINKIKLLSNNPDKRDQLQDNGISVIECISTGFYLKRENKSYLAAKINKTGHCFADKILNYEKGIFPC